MAGNRYSAVYSGYSDEGSLGKLCENRKCREVRSRKYGAKFRACTWDIRISESFWMA